MNKVLFSFLLIFFSFAGSYSHSQEQINDIEPNQTEKIMKEKFPSYFTEELEKTEAEGDSRFYEEFLNMLFYLGIIIFLFLIIVWFLKRAQHARINQLNQTSAIKILDSRALTPKTNLYVLNIYDKVITIADSVNGVTLLSENGFSQMEKKFENLMNKDKH